MIIEDLELKETLTNNHIEEVQKGSKQEEEKEGEAPKTRKKKISKKLGGSVKTKKKKEKGKSRKS